MLKCLSIQESLFDMESIIKEIKKISEENLNEESHNSEIVKDFSRTIEMYKSLIEAGVASPRGYQMSSCEERFHVSHEQ